MQNLLLSLLRILLSVPPSMASVDANSLPLESVFRIEGSYGCIVSVPYRLTITQKGTSLTYDVTNAGMSRQAQVMNYKVFEDLWRAYVPILASPREDYGTVTSTADFHGTLSSEVTLREQTTSRQFSLQCGVIDDDNFRKMLTTIMQALPSRLRIPEYSVLFIDYSKLPHAAFFQVVRLEYAQESGSYRFEIRQNGNSVDCAGEKDGVPFARTIPIQAFKKFWNQCAVIDLVSLRESTSGYIYKDPEAQFYFNIETTDGRIRNGWHISKEQNKEQEKVRLLYQMVLKLVDGSNTVTDDPNN